jgi:hypothetical protein
MKSKSQKAPVTFDDALEALEAFSDANFHRGYPTVAILVPLAEVSPPTDGDFCPAVGHGPFGYQPLPDAPPKEEVGDSPPTLASLAKEVAAELGLSRASTPEQLQQLRREFMWRNHPDRRPDLPAQWSNARVAIANTLIDRAIKEPHAPV